MGSEATSCPKPVTDQRSPKTPQLSPSYLPFNLANSAGPQPLRPQSPESEPPAPPALGTQTLQAVMATALSWTQAPGPPASPPTRLPVLGLPALAGL